MKVAPNPKKTDENKIRSESKSESEREGMHPHRPTTREGLEVNEINSDL